MRVSHELNAEEIRITKFLNLSHGFTPNGLELNEHYCRRWLPVAALTRSQQKLAVANPNKPLLLAQRALFVERQEEYFVITLARPFALQPSYHSSVSIGFLMDADFKDAVRFWNDESIERVQVNETCERCGLSAMQCRERVASPDVYEKGLRQRTREKVLAKLIGSGVQRRSKSARKKRGSETS
jgi:hypothetical protein